MAEQQGTYVFDQRSIDERLRLEKQSKILNEAIDSLAPVDVSQIKRVVDLACGTGSWIIDISKRHPHLECVGVDSATGILAFAKAQAKLEKTSTTFYEMDVTQPLPFPDASFDLLNMRLVFGFLKPDMWVPLFKECLRILRPGGIVVVTEQTTMITSDTRYQEMMMLWGEAFARAGYFFNTDARWMHSGVVLNMKRLLSHAGFVQPSHLAHLVDFSYGLPAHEPVIENMIAAYELGERLLIGTKVATRAEVARMQERIKTYKGKEDFLGHWNFVTTYGSKP